MNQRILNHFDLVFNDKYFSFSFIPGTVNFEDVEGALEAFKAEISEFKKKALEAEQAKKDEQENSKQETPQVAPEGE